MTCGVILRVTSCLCVWEKNRSPFSIRAVPMFPETGIFPSLPWMFSLVVDQEKKCAGCDLKEALVCTTDWIRSGFQSCVVSGLQAWHQSRMGRESDRAGTLQQVWVGEEKINISTRSVAIEKAILTVAWALSEGEVGNRGEPTIIQRAEKVTTKKRYDY